VFRLHSTSGNGAAISTADRNSGGVYVCRRLRFAFERAVFGSDSLCAVAANRLSYLRSRQ
jgi:hypothetical protein